MKTWKPPTNELIEKTLKVSKKGIARRYFFSRLKNPLWIQPLVERGYFKSPPRLRRFDDGYVQLPSWPVLQYLSNVAREVPDEVVNLVLGLPKVNNPSVYDGILKIALQLPGTQSAKLKPKILESVGMEHESWADRAVDLLIHWTAERQISAALELTEVLVAFVPDPRSEYKRRRQKKNPADSETLLEPSPRMHFWEYDRLMSKGVRPLAESEPHPVARILVDATANMIRWQTHQDALDKAEDHSETWCKRLARWENDHESPAEMLVHTLTFACERIYEKSPDLVVDLDVVLRNQQWSVFKRLRHHLYAQYPNEETKPWIRELILACKNYDWGEHCYEFQQMIRSACEHFGAALLTKAERKRIFDAILDAPSEANFREWLGEEFTEERFQNRRRYFHRMQLRPFAAVLFGEYATYYQELEVAANAPGSDEDYPPFKITTTNALMSKCSPRSSKDLANLTDEELLTYINRWDREERLYEDNRFVEINIEGLAEAVQTVFKELIIPDANRLRFWMENPEKIKWSIYVRAMINVMQKRVEAENFDNLNEWLRFSGRALLHTDRQRETDDGHGGTSRENRERYCLRRAVDDFIEVCMEEDVDAPVSARGELAKLLELLCTQFDWHLELDLNRNDPIDEGINNTRDRALEALVKFGVWLQKRDSESQVSEVTTILEKRFALKTECPLTLSEYAILGKNYLSVFNFNRAWAAEHKSDFFPQGEFSAWLAAYGSFVRHNRPLASIFEVLRDDFDFALQHLTDFKAQDCSEEKRIDILGQRLFIYYLWEMYPLRGEDSLLERYYQGTAEEREQWANLFRYVGDVVRGSRKHLDKSQKDRIIAFFDWRFEVKEPTELGQFAFWMRAKCLAAEWRLDAYSKILDVCRVEGESIPLEALCELLPNHTAKVVECFAKLTDRIGEDNIYIHRAEANTILKAGLGSSDESVIQNAERARENLLREGRIDLLNIDGR
jgi:hypothetical protein